MSGDLFISYLAEVAPQVEAQLHRYLQVVPEGSPKHRYLYGILEEFISRGGKRVRPAMTMLACAATGGDTRKALRSGCAIEVFHAAALIHDDIMDASMLRREQKCAHILHGTPLAINAGDYALGLVCTIVVRDPLLEEHTKLEVLDVIGEMSARTVEGQALDVGWVRDNVYDLTVQDYLEMALGKTGYYSGIAPLRVGAIIAGATVEEERALKEFGEKSSVAFQIQDDLLNILGDEQTMGKDFLSDVLESKRTLMVIHSLMQASASDRERLVELLHLGPVKEQAQCLEVVEILRRTGSIDYARSYARRLIREALSHLKALEESPARAVLASMADFFLERER